MIDLIEWSDISTELMATKMVEFTDRFLLTRQPPPIMPDAEWLVQKFQRTEKSEFDAILAVLKNKLQL